MHMNPDFDIDEIVENDITECENFYEGALMEENVDISALLEIYEDIIFGLEEDVSKRTENFVSKEADMEKVIDGVNADISKWFEEESHLLEAYQDAVSKIYVKTWGEAPNYENFDLEESDMEKVIGDVESDMKKWHEQSEDACTIAAQEFVLEALTGREFHMDELRVLAEEKGWFDHGAALWDIGNLCEYYGLQVDKFVGGTIEDIEECLKNGGKVLAALDSEEIWTGKNEEFFLPGMDADHVVQVIGLDYTDYKNPKVILNDSGAANGCGAEVCMKDFMDAWKDSGRFMVTVHA